MSTRGVYGFKKNGQHKVSYNHCDSYPSWLGEKILDFLREKNVEQLNQIYDSIQLVDGDSKPTVEDVSAWMPYANLRVSNQSVEDWYCLTRDAQGKLEVNEELGQMVDAQNFLGDSLFCEWTYLIDLDHNELHVYNRGLKELWNSWSLDNLPDHMPGEQ